jgi:hypothetical protein
MHTDRRTAVPDPALTAVVLRQTPLYYRDGADPATDRPAHVRAGSSLARVPGGIALVQDDANFLAIVDPDTALARAIALPAGAGGVRQFDAGRGNKADKLDLEACVAAHVDGETVLVAFGSGSTPRREGIAFVGSLEETEPVVRLVQAPGFYARLREEIAFAGDALNLEGAVLQGDRLLLFARGNGRAQGAHLPSAATCSVGWSALLAFLGDPVGAAAPPPADVRRYELGLLNGVRLGFTDGARWGQGVLFTAAAEASPDAVEDGAVEGSVIGIIGADGDTRWTPLVSEDGAAFSGKVEGLLAPHDEAGHLYAVVDGDDADTPSVLCTIRLDGPWQDQRNARAAR